MRRSQNGVLAFAKIYHQFFKPIWGQIWSAEHRDCEPCENEIDVILNDSTLPLCSDSNYRRKGEWNTHRHLFDWRVIFWSSLPFLRRITMVGLDLEYVCFFVTWGLSLSSIISRSLFSNFFLSSSSNFISLTQKIIFK